jgi:imidazolonepropionase-like amidohydrolase
MSAGPGIVIRDGKILAVDADVQQQVVSTANVIDLTDSDTILPGMIDLHAHYNLDLVDNGRVEEVVYNGIIFLANGVTSLISAGSVANTASRRRQTIAQPGRTTSPKMKCARK